MHSICQEYKLSALLIIAVTHQSQWLWIVLWWLIGGHFNRTVRKHILRQLAPPFDSLVLQIRLCPDYEIRSYLMYAIELCKLIISTEIYSKSLFHRRSYSFELKDVRCTSSSCFADKMVGILLKDAIIPILICSCEWWFRYVLTHTQVVTLEWWASRETIKSRRLSQLESCPNILARNWFQQVRCLT